MSLLDRVAWSVLGSGLFLVLGAIVSHLTGTHVQVADGKVINTHAPATLVLVFLGIALVVNGFVLLSHGDSASADAAPRGDDRD